METTMKAFENTVTIRRPAEEVFAFLTDFENVPLWNYAIDETRKTSPGPVGVGTTYRQVRSVPSRSVEEFEVTTFNPPRRVEIQGAIGPFQARIRYALDAMGEATKLTNAVELTPSSIASTLLGPLAVQRVKAAVASNLEVLKRVLEARSQGIS
jgi:uncharacterized protein YndB with AHSA1/START domain